MTKIERFEDVQTWQQGRVLGNMVYDATESGTFARDFGLRDQIQEAAGSVMHNIAEGFDSGSDAEFIRFLKYARRSASEIQSEIVTAQPSSFRGDTLTGTRKSLSQYVESLRASPLQRTFHVLRQDFTCTR